MKSTLGTILVLFLAVNVGVLYYIVLFGDVPEFSRRLDLLERRVDSLVRREEPVMAIPEVRVGEDVVVLSDQQKAELVTETTGELETKLAELVGERVESAVEQALGTKQAGVKEYFIPLGRASVKTSNHSWQNTGIQVDLDLAQYGEGAVVTFEATLSVPTENGQVEARLVDGVTGYVPGSEIAAGGSGGTYRQSGGLSLGQGRRVLKLEMRTSLDYEGVLENGRLRVKVGG